MDAQFLGRSNPPRLLPLVRRPGDHQTIGLLLCQNKDSVMTGYALRDVHKPIGISDYELAQALPKDIKSGLPSIEERESKLNQELQEDKNTL